MLDSLRDAGTEKYTYFALLERRTCKVCGKLDGKSFPVAEQKVGVNMHPMHPNCRCFIGPYRPEEERTGRRTAESSNGGWMYVPQTMTYTEWYRKYVEGNPPAVEKAVRNRAADKEQLAKYQSVLGENAPKTLEDFQNLKYNEPEKWKFTKLDYDRRQDLAQHPEKALPNAENAVAPEPKFTKYLFDPSSIKGWPKGKAFDSRLGYNATNWKELQQEIQRNAKEYPVTSKGNNGYGEQYEQKTILYGGKGTPANVVVGWIVKENGNVSMTTAMIKEVK